MARFTLPRDVYHGKGCLSELKNLKGKKAVLVVGGGSMKRQGFLDKAVNYLKEGGMEVKLIEGVEPDPSVETVMKGAKVMQEFEPDWIVAMGGGSPIDAAKAMWVFYEYPDETFENIITPFSFPELRQKAKFAAIQSQYKPNVGQTWNGDWGGAIQCFGFARMVFYQLFGCNMPNRYYGNAKYKYQSEENVDLVGQISGSSVTTDSAKNLLQQGKLGDIIQACGSGNGGQHTMVFVSADDNGVTVYDCNARLSASEPACVIHQWTIKWSTWASYYGSGDSSSENGISLYRASNYAQIYGDGDGMFYDDSVNFVIENGVLKKYNGWQAFVEIPDTVTAIGDEAFKNNTSMVSVSIPDSVKSIGDSAFYGCTSLLGVVIPDSVEKTGRCAFQKCSKLASAYLPVNEKFTVINTGTFYECMSLKEIIVPDNIVKIEFDAFYNCRNLKNIDLSKILNNPFTSNKHSRHEKNNEYDFKLNEVKDTTVLYKQFKEALDKHQGKEIDVHVTNIDRSFGTLFGSEITKKYGTSLEEDTFKVNCYGAGGQSFGAFIPQGLTLHLYGDSNDYFGKGLSGGKLIVVPPKDSTIKPEDNIIIGNVALYGATSGKVFVGGVAGERFAVRNSGVRAVVEGVGDHGCEYMTGGCVVVLGQVGKNFAAGMSGGIAYVLDLDSRLYQKVNKAMVNIERVTDKYDVQELKGMIQEHVAYTNSEVGKKILDNFKEYLPKFKKIIPEDYEKMMSTIIQMEEKGLSREKAKIEAFNLIKNGR